MTRIPWVRSAIASEKPVAYCVAVSLAAVVVPTAVRFAIALFAPQLLFATYYPAILICTLLTNWRYGALTAALSAIIVYGLFAGNALVELPDGALFAGLAIYLAANVVIIATAESLRRSLRELDHANGTARALNIELQHRVRNTLAVVQGLASLTAETTEPKGFLSAFSGRLQALAEAHDLLGQKAVGTTSLTALIDAACEPFRCGDKIVMSGPACSVPAESCVPLVLAVHELCTNAAKYGALSTPEGKVAISWGYSPALGRVEIVWEESGGPLVRKQTRKGLGSALLVPQTGLAEVELNFDPTGVRCTFSIDGAEPLEVLHRQDR